MTPTDDPPDPGGPDGPGAFGNEERPITTEDLIALREGDLDEEQARHVRERIESDPEAVAELLDQLDQTDALLERFRSQPPPPELSERLDAVIADEIAARDARRSGGDPPDADQRGLPDRQQEHGQAADVTGDDGEGEGDDPGR